MSRVTADQSEANRSRVRAAFEARRDGTGSISGLLADDIVWQIEGHSVASRRYDGKQELTAEVLVPFAARFRATADPFRPADIRGVYADGDTIIVLWNGHGTANDGGPYDNSYAWFLTMRNGKVIDGTAFYDSISFNDLWDRVQPA